MSSLTFNTNYDAWFEELYGKMSREYSVPFSLEKKGSVCFDIGGNVGAFTCYYGHCFDNVVVVEASSNNIGEIVKNTKNHNLDNVVIKHKAVYNVTDDVVRLRAYRNPTHDKECGSSSIIDFVDPKTNHGYKEEDEFEEVTSISLEDLTEGYDKIDYMKVDVEGGEFDFLYNKDLSKIEYMFLEVHAQLGDKKQLFIDYLIEQMDVVSHAKGGHDMLYLKKKT